MKFSLFLLVFFAGLAVVLSALALAPKLPGIETCAVVRTGECSEEEIPRNMGISEKIINQEQFVGKPGDCWTEQTGPLRKGQEYDLKGLCQRATCSSDGVTVFESCGIAAGPNGPLTNYDYAKPYPKCCPHL